MKRLSLAAVFILIIGGAASGLQGVEGVTMGTAIGVDPPLRVVDLQGNTVVLQDRILPERHDGEATLLVFWATWCAPCIREIPELRELQRFYGPKGLRIVSLGLNMAGETPQRLAGASKRHGIDYPILFDAEGAGQDAFGITALPMSALIDRDGVVRWKGVKLPRDINERIQDALKPREDSASEQ